MKIILFLFLLFLPVVAQEKFVLPVDEASQDAAFLAFRTKLIEAVQKRDTKFVLSIVDKSIKNGFGGNDGINEFKKQWKIYNRNSELWKELLIVLTHGGTFDKENKGSFYAPYLFTNFPDEIDAFEHQAIFGSNVNLRAKPDTNAPIVASLSYNIVKTDYQNSIKSPQNKEQFSWLKVETLGGKKGYVKPEFVRSSIDYRAGFERRRGKWTMTFFLAGD
ncbi:MAG TPA: SH3 domain-containing protein [Pyrinomonadaceae bacterium]|nr:SH3 domain-containing protein [Pyrinomonadaceae bacterium]